MIVRPKLHWLRMLFVWHGSVLHRILPQLIGIVILSMLVVFLKQQYPAWVPNLTPIPFTLLGIALAIFLGFRNSVCYDRFWEARKIWGNILNHTRSLARQHLSLTDATEEKNRAFIYTLIAFVHALKAQLRGTDNEPRLQQLLSTDAEKTAAAARFKPAVILLELAKQLTELRSAKKVSPIILTAIDKQLSQLTECLGGCERIASTPVPFTYSVILHRTIYLYCFLLPFGLAGSIGMMTPLIVVFVSYTFLALEALADELQDPFGTEANDLALDAMSDMIEATLREMLGEQAYPPPATPVKHILT